MKNTIIAYEHDLLKIGDKGFTALHFESLISLNNQHRNNYFSIEPKGIRLKHYVGVIQLNNITIEIRPKADKNNDEHTKRKWQNVLIDMLKVCKKIKIHAYENALLTNGRLNLLELYFDQYLTEVQILIRQGLVKKYRLESGNVNSLKGKLNFAQHIRHNLVHKERFYTTHQVYDVDHTIHQILSQAMDIVKKLSNSIWISEKCRRVQLDFPEVKKIHATKQLLDSIQINRKTTPYKRAIELARLIILNYSPDISHGKEKMISILFNMNQLWEEYVLIKLKQAAQNHASIKVLGKGVKPFWNSNRLEPDIVLEKDGEKYIIDTKWKTPEKPTSVQDLRQMYTYGRFWNAHKIMLLYPGNHGTTDFTAFHNVEHIRLEHTDQYEERQHQCMKGFVSVIHEEGNRLNDKLGEKILDIFQLL